MKKILKCFLCLIMVISTICVFPGKANAATYKDADLKVGDVVHMGNFMNISGKTSVRYFYSTQEEKPFQTYDYEAGNEPTVKTIGDNFDCVVLYNEIEDGVRVIELYPLVNNGVGGVGVCGLSEDETVLGGSWMDFNDCRGKTRTIRYFKDGEEEPFYTQTTGSRYMRVLKRADTASFDTLGYTVSYWHVKNVDSYSAIVDLVAGRDIGLAGMVKANEMYRGQIIAAGTLIDYSAARYISLHFYQSEFIYEHGNEFYCFSYHDRKEGEERFVIAGQGYPHTAYKVMSANTSHVHLAALDSYFETPDESVVNAGYLRAGDVVYNGSVLTYDSYGSKSVNFYSSDRTLISGEAITTPQGITVSDPDGVSAGSWVVFNADDYGIDLAPLNFSAEGLLIPSDENRDEAYSGACVEVGGRNYYYYDSLSVAIADAKANASLSRNNIIGEKNVLNKDLNCEKVLLLKNMDLIDSSMGALSGVCKGIVIDFNGHNASGVRVGPIPAKETLVFTNSSDKKSCITGSDAFVDNNTRYDRTGTVVFNNLNIASKIYPAMHTIYLLNGEYVLNSATVMDNDIDNSITRDTEECPLYKFNEDYPYRASGTTPSDTDQLGGSSAPAPQSGDTPAPSGAQQSDEPVENSSTDASLMKTVLPIAVIAVAAVGIVVAGIIIAKKKKNK